MNSNWRNQVSSVMLTKMIILHHLHVSLVSSFRVPSVSPTLVTGRHFTMVAGVSSFTCLKTELKIPEFVPRQVCGEKRLETWTVYWGLLFSTTLPLHRQPACFPRYSGPSAGYAMFVYTGTVEDDIFHISMKSIFLYSCKSWPCKGKSNIIWSWASQQWSHYKQWSQYNHWTNRLVHLKIFWQLVWGKNQWYRNAMGSQGQGKTILWGTWALAQ